ncbi:MAG: pyridoxal-phosphate dependent enzyme [Alphaproteobacteria bacterium]|nr:pyridoxal-phosphate dependent enzyme [Alphaproteobacteria bacterium]
MDLPTIKDLRDAAARLAPHVRRTPLLESDALNAQTGARLLVKAECLQRFGSFKLRGATNCIAAMSPDVRKNGVAAFSSGNHAIAVAAAARTFGVPAVIVMPGDAPRAKTHQVRALGGEVIAYDRVREDREIILGAIARERGLPIVRPFDDPFVIAGQGTCGLEIADDLTALGLAPDVALAPASGGGLASGLALALRDRFPKVEIYPVEPEGHDDLRRSLAAGAIVENAPGVRSICDALMAQRMGDLPFAIGADGFADAIAVSDDSVRAAMRAAFARLKIVVEPGGAAALAAVLSGAIDVRGKTVVVIASGGNVDADVFADVLRDAN